MSVFEITGRCYQKVTNEYPECLSYLQLCALHVAAHYKLRRNSMGWFADGYVRADGAVIMHSPDTIRSLLKLRLLEGNACGENIASGAWVGNPTMDPPVPMLWTNAMGKRLLDEITTETGLIFDKENCELVNTKPGATSALVLGNFSTEREAALARDRALILIYGDAADTKFSPGKANTSCFPTR